MNVNTFFSVQRLHGFRQVVQHAQWHCKSINFQINTRGRLLIEGHKRELVKDLYIVQEAVITNNKPKNGKNKPPKQHKNKTENNPQKRNDWLPVHWQIHARGDNLVSSHHGMAANIDKKGRTPTYTRPYPQEGDRSNKAHCGNQGSPQPGSPRSQRAAVRYNIHPGTSKQTPTTPGRNESGEKRINGETGGETWSMVKNDSSSYGIQGALRVRSVVLFQSSSSLGAAVHSYGVCCFQNCIQCDRVSDDR